MSKKNDYTYENFDITVTFTITTCGRGDTHEERQKEAEGFAKEWVKNTFKKVKLRKVHLSSESTRKAK